MVATGTTAVPVWHQYKGDPTEIPLYTLETEKLGLTLTHTDAFMHRFTDKAAWGTPCCHVTVVFCEKAPHQGVISAHEACRGFPEDVHASVEEAIARNKFTGEKGTNLYVPMTTSAGVRSVMFVGMGRYASLIPFEAAEVGKQLGLHMASMEVCQVSFVLPDLAGGGHPCTTKDGCLTGRFAEADKKRKDKCPVPTGYGQHLRPDGLNPQEQDLSIMRLVEEFICAQKRDKRFRGKTEKAGAECATNCQSPPTCPTGCVLEKVELVCGVVLSTTLMGEGGGRDMIAPYAEGKSLAAQLGGTPANYLNPCTYANMAMAFAKTNGLTCVRLGGAELAERGCRAALAVNQGSEYEAQLIHMTYRPPNVPASEKLPVIAYVGKAVTMDTGGYNVKTAAGSIHLMKGDMAGSAAVVGCAYTIANLKPTTAEVHFIFLAVENMIDSKAYRPGDVVTAANGKTIEVINTDAEGRLTLADAMHYAQTATNPDALVTIATLTGVAKDALGTKAAALYSNNLSLRDLITTSGQEAGEVLWPMPIIAEYAKDLKSPMADLKNTPTERGAGSINACNFLMEFVQDRAYAHIDMAGPMFSPEALGTGFASKTLTQSILNLPKYI